jgi:hypothetical protein
VASAENVAVMLQEEPLALRLGNVYGILEANGGFMTIGAPPHEFVMVNVPVEGGSVTVMVPLTLYCCVAWTHAVGFAVMPLNVHRMAQFVAPPPLI